MIGGHREVVHHRQRLDLNGPVDSQFSVGVHAVIGDVRAEQIAVTEEVQFARGRANLRVRSHRIVELAVEVVTADCLQILGDLVGQ